MARSAGPAPPQTAPKAPSPQRSVLSLSATQEGGALPESRELEPQEEAVSRPEAPSLSFGSLPVAPPPPTVPPDEPGRSSPLTGSVLSSGGRPFGLQFKRGLDLPGDDLKVHAVARQGLQGSSGPLPHLQRIQSSFGRHSLEGVRAFQGPAARASSRQLGAEAFTRGESIAFRRPPDLATAAHEAAHVVQQRAGLLSGGIGRVGDPFEQAAEAVAGRVLAGLPASDLLPAPVAAGGSAPAVQRKSRTLGVLPKGADPAKDKEIFLVPGSNSASGILAEVRGWVTDRHAERIAAGEITAAEAQEIKDGYAVAVVGSTLTIYTLGGDKVGSYAYGKKKPHWPPGYYLESSDGKVKAPLLREGYIEFSHVIEVDDAGKPVAKPTQPEEWFETKELERLRKEYTAKGLKQLVIAVPVGGSGSGSGDPEGDLAWSKGKVDELQNKLKQLAPPAGGSAPAAGKTPPKAGEGAKPGEKGQGPAQTLPDRVVRWLDANGAHLNVWADGAVQTLTLREGETVDQLLERVKAVAKALREGRDPERSERVADGAEKTSVVDEKGKPVGQAGPMPEEQAIPGSKRTANTPAYPARIVNFGPDITVSGASNRFQMEIDYRPAGHTTLDQVAARMQRITYYWEIFNVTGLTPEKVAAKEREKVGAGEQKTAADAFGDDVARSARQNKEDAVADVKETLVEANPALVAATWPARSAWLGVVGLSTGIRAVGSVISSFISIVTTPANEQSIGFSEPGDYVVRCVATPRAADDAAIVRASSVAVAVVRVQNINQRAQEANEESVKELEKLRKELAALPEGQEKEDLAKRIAALEKAEKLNALESTRATLKALDEKVAVVERLEEDIAKHVPRVARSPEVRLLDAQLQLAGIPLAEYKAQLKRQIKSVEVIEASALSFGRHFRGTNFRPHVVLASEENGLVTQMLMMLGEAKDSDAANGRVHWVLADITSKNTQQVYDGKSSKSGVAGHQEAIRNAFVDFRENAEYGRGTIAIRLPQAVSDYAGGAVTIEPRMRAAPGSRARAMGRLRDLATAAEIAGLVIAGPAGLAIGAAGAVAGAIVAIDSLSRRSRGDRLHWDFETIMDVTAIVGGVAGAGGALLGTLARLPKWVNRVERVQGILHIYGVTELGSQVLIIPLQLEMQLAELEKNTSLSPGEKAARRAEAILQAVRSGAMGVVSAAQMLHVDPATHQPQVGGAEGEAGGLAKPKVSAGEGAAAAPDVVPARPAAAEGAGAVAAPKPAKAPVEEGAAPRPKEGQGGEGGKKAGEIEAGAGAEGAAGGPAKKPAAGEERPTGAGGLPRRTDLEEALGDLKGKVQVVEHPTLEGTQVRYVGGEVVVEIGAKTAAKKGAAAVAHHVATARELLRYSGTFGSIRRLVSKVFGMLRFTPGYGTQGFESRLEVRKLRSIIGELEGLMARIDAHAADLSKRKVDAETAKKEISEEIKKLEQQLAEHEALVNSYSPGRGFVAARAETPQALMNATLLELGEQFPHNQAVEKGPLIRLDDVLELHPSFIQDLKARKQLGEAGQTRTDLDLLLDATRALRENGGDRSKLTQEQRAVLTKASASKVYRLDFDDTLGARVDKTITDYGLERLQIFKDLLAKPVEDSRADRARLAREFLAPSTRIGSKASGVWGNKAAGRTIVQGPELQATLYRYAADYAASRNPQSVSDFINHFQFYLSEKKALFDRLEKQVLDSQKPATPDPTGQAQTSASPPPLGTVLGELLGIPDYASHYPQGQTLGSNQITGAIWAKILSEASDARTKTRKQKEGERQGVGKRFAQISKETQGHVGTAKIEAGLDAPATIAAVQALPEVPMSSVSGAAYHAAKHHSELSKNGFPSTTNPPTGEVPPKALFAEYWAAAQDTIKNPGRTGDGSPDVVANVDPSSGGLKIEFSKNGMTAFVLVKPDGTVRLLTFFTAK